MSLLLCARPRVRMMNEKDGNEIATNIMGFALENELHGLGRSVGRGGVGGGKSAYIRCGVSGKEVVA